ncbi:MAG: helix-turn-helix domain-containing protein [Syntrophales bacterium]
MGTSTLGDRIRAVRKSMRLNQLDFAKIMHLESATAISKYEDNSRTPDKDKLIIVAELGNITLDELLTGEGEMLQGPRGLVVHLGQNTGIAVEHILAMLPQVKAGLEIHYSQGLREKAVSHMLEFQDGGVQFAYSELNMDRRPRQLEVDEIRYAFKENGKPLLSYNANIDEVIDLVNYPSYEKFKDITTRAFAALPPDSPAMPTTYADAPRHPVAALMPVPGYSSPGIDPALQAMSDIKDIFDSGDPILIPAIQANLSAFKRALMRERQFAQVIKENEDLKNRISKLESLCKEIPNLKSQIETVQTENKDLRKEVNRLKATYENPDGTDGRITNTSDQAM